MLRKALKCWKMVRSTLVLKDVICCPVLSRAEEICGMLVNKGNGVKCCLVVKKKKKLFEMHIYAEKC